MNILCENRKNDYFYKFVKVAIIVLTIYLFMSVDSVYAAYDLNDVKEKMIDKGWKFIDNATPTIAVSGGLIGAFMARNMDWGMRAIGFCTGTIGFGLAIQGVKAYYDL